MEAQASADPFWLLVATSPALGGLVIWFIKKYFRGLDTRLDKFESTQKQILNSLSMSQLEAKDLQMKLAVFTTQIDVQLKQLYQEVGELKGRYEKLNERVNGISQHYQRRIEGLESKNG